MTYLEREMGTERLKKIIRESKLDPQATQKLIDWWRDVLKRNKVISLEEYRRAKQ